MDELIGAEESVTSHPPLDGDPGLQRERTALAWRRTALATAVAGLVVAGGWIRLLAPAALDGPPGHAPATAVVVALGALAAGLGLGGAVGLVRRGSAPGRPAPPLGAGAALVVALAALGAGAALVGVGV